MKNAIYKLLTKYLKFPIPLVAEIVYRNEKPLWVYRELLMFLSDKGDKANWIRLANEAAKRFPKNKKLRESISIVAGKKKQSDLKSNLKKSNSIIKFKLDEESLIKELSNSQMNDKSMSLINALVRIYKLSALNPIFFTKILKIIEENKSWVFYNDILEKLMISFPNKHYFYIRKSNYLLNNNKIDLAYQYLKLAAATGSVYALVKRFSFELDWSFDHRDSFELLMKKKFFEFSGAIFRNFDLLNESEKVILVKKVKEHLKTLDIGKVESKSQLNILRSLIRIRLISQAQSINKTVKDKSIKGYIDEINRRIKNIKSICEAATENSFSFTDEYYAFLNGEKIKIKKGQESVQLCVEVAIPTVFYSIEDEEKPTYSTVRQLFENLIGILINSKDIIVIPFQQYNWRQYNRRFQKTLVIAYHAHGIPGDALIVHESQVAGRCSLDSKGFAGYSSLANNFAEIVEYADKNRNEIATKFEKLRSDFVANNKTKYPQKKEFFECNRDFIFLPLQIPTDVVAKVAYIQTIELLKFVVAASMKGNIQFVVKPHPFNNSSEIDEILSNLEACNNIKITNASIFDVLSSTHCKAVLTTNSGVGLDSMYFLKPVFVAGKCDYQYGVADTIGDKSQLQDFIDDYQSLIAKNSTFESREKEFVCFYNEAYTVQVDDVESIKERIQSEIKKLKGFGKA